jgi:hypothetical protein
MKKWIVIFLMVIAFALRADYRKYVWTYEALLMPKGEWEVENYFTFFNPPKGGKSTVEEWFELEYGISEYFDISMYQTFKQKEGESFKYDGLKLRLRGRPWLSGEKFIDFVFYFEPQLRGSTLDEEKIETKLIFTKPFGKFSISSNIIHEWEREPGSPDVNEYKVQFAGRYEVAAGFSAGIEFETKFLDTRAGKAPTYLIGPTISYGKGRVYFNAGARFGLNDRSDNLQIRTILGITF